MSARLFLLLIVNEMILPFERMEAVSLNLDIVESPLMMQIQDDSA